MQNSPDDDLSLTSGLDDDDFRTALAEVTSGAAKEDEPAQEAAAEDETPPVEPETVEETPEGEEQVEAAEEETPAQDAAADEDEADKDDGEADKDEPAEDLTKELSHLPKEVRDQFADLEPGAQRLVLDRYKHLEDRADKKFKEASDLKKTADEQVSIAKQFDDVLRPHKQHLDEAGLSPAQAVSQALAFRDGLVKDPIDSIVKIADVFLSGRGDLVGSSRAQTLIRQLAAKARVDLEGLDDDVDDARSMQPSPEAETIAHLQQTVQHLQDRIDTSEKSTHELSVAQGQRMWEKFKDSPDNRHAERLEAEITEILGSQRAKAIIDPAEKLKWAYDRAVMADPDAHKERLAEEREALRKEVLAEQEKLRKQQSEAVRKVPTQKAKAASTTPKPASPVTAKPNGADGGESWEQAFRSDFKELFDGGASRV